MSAIIISRHSSLFRLAAASKPQQTFKTVGCAGEGAGATLRAGDVTALATRLATSKRPHQGRLRAPRGFGRIALDRAHGGLGPGGAGRRSRRGEVGAEADAAGPYLHQAAVEHAGDGGGDFWLAGLRAATPNLQPNAVGERGHLAEAGEELVAKQVTFGGAERGWGQGHGVVLPC